MDEQQPTGNVSFTELIIHISKSDGLIATCRNCIVISKVLYLYACECISLLVKKRTFSFLPLRVILCERMLPCLMIIDLT